MDAGALGAIAALLNTKMLKYEDGKIVREFTDNLPMKDKPIAITIGKISDKLLIDLNLEEEGSLDARLTITTMENGNLCAMQKGGKGHFSTKEIEQAVDLSIQKGKELRGLL